MHNISPEAFQKLIKGYGSTRVMLALGAVCLALAGWFVYSSMKPAAQNASQATAVQAASLPTRATPSQTPLPSMTPLPTRTATPTPTLTSTPSPTATPGEGQAGIIGYSVEGRPLEVVRFGSGARRRMIAAGIHGGYEDNTVRLADALIDAIRSDPKLVPADTTLFIVRVINPDGLARGAVDAGRANANGVDLNRNWDARWQAEWQRAGCWNKLLISAGTGPFSEPETQALAAFISREKISALISYHSAGLGVSAGGQPAADDSINLAQDIARVTGYAYPPKFSTCELTGQFIDWAASQGIAAVDVELNNHADTDLLINLRALKAFLNWKLPTPTPSWN